MEQEYSSFGEFFRAEIMPGMIRGIEPAMDHLRRTNPEQWLRIAMRLRNLGSYDRVEQQREVIEAFRGLVQEISNGLLESVPEYVRLHDQAMEAHFVRHGIELDDLLHKHPSAEPMSTGDAVDAQMRAWGINFKVNPDDQR